MHIMLDIESLGTGPDAVITAIGACKFDPSEDEVSEHTTFYTRVNPNQQGRVIDASTVMWWLKQSDAARSMYAGIGKEPLLPAALMSFGSWCTSVRIDGMWGNGSDFDNAILGHAYKQRELPLPWSYGKNRCFRTVKNMLLPKEYVAPVREGTHHNALDDAIYQARCLQAICKATGITF